MKTENIDYREGDHTFEGHAAYDDSQKGKRPAVLVFHTWAGLEDFERGVADRLAKMGYVAFAADVFGKGKRASKGFDAEKLMQEAASDRAALQRRLFASIASAKEHPMVDASRAAAIGFCFGGLCVLDIARSGTDEVKGVVSLHGVFAPSGLPEKQIKTKVLALHGYSDPMAKPEQMVALGNELDRGKADWQIHAFGGVMHGFTKPSANDPAKGLQYSESATKRSWIAVENFLKEIF